MATLITRIGRRDDPKRSMIKLDPRVGGSYGGHVLKDATMVNTYGNSLSDAIRMSFFWAGIRLYTIFDAVEEIAEILGEDD